MVRKKEGDFLGNLWETGLKIFGAGAALEAIVRRTIEEEKRKERPNGLSPEERFAQFLSDAALPRKAFLYTPPNLQDPSDVVRDREEPILLSPRVAHFAKILLQSRRSTDGLPEYVDKLDKFWALQYAATVIALEFLAQYHTHHNRPDYSPRYEDFLAGRFLMYKRLFDHIKVAMPNLQGKKVIEIGGGSGLSLTMLAKEGAEVYNLDISEIALKFSEFLAEHYGVKGNLHTEGADFYKTRLPAGKFDLTYNVGVMEHLKPNEQASLLEEMIRITADGGMVMASVPNQFSPHYGLIREKESQIPEDMRLPMPFHGYVDPVELLKSGGLKPANDDGTYARGYTQIAPPTRIGPGVIKPEDFEFFRQLPYERGSTMETLLRAWHLLEKDAPQRILERYALFTHAFGRKAG